MYGARSLDDWHASPFKGDQDGDGAACALRSRKRGCRVCHLRGGQTAALRDVSVSLSTILQRSIIAIVFSACAGVANGQNYPLKAIRIVTTGSGGATDFTS